MNKFDKQFLKIQKKMNLSNGYTQRKNLQKNLEQLIQ